MNEERRPSEFSRWLFDDGEHLTDEAIAAAAEHAGESILTADERRHLEGCTRCRRELEDTVAAFVASPADPAAPGPPAELERRAARAAGDDVAPTGKAAWSGAWTWAAAAVVLVGLFLLIPEPGPGRADTPTRSHGAVADSGMSPRGTVEPFGVREFAWAAVEGATAYRLVVLDLERGAERVVDVDIREPVWRPGPEELAKFRPGASYEWFVRVERGPGRSYTTEAVRFSVPPGR